MVLITDQDTGPTAAAQRDSQPGCDGSEDDINDCYHFDVDNCGTSEGAGVTCTTTTLNGIRRLNILLRGVGIQI